MADCIWLVVLLKVLAMFSSRYLERQTLITVLIILFTVKPFVRAFLCCFCERQLDLS